MMFDEGLHDASGAFGPQGELPSAAVFEDVHLFLHDVGRLAETALEEIEGFEGGRADFAEAEPVETVAGLPFERRETFGIRRQDVLRPAHRLELRHRAELYYGPSTTAGRAVL